MDVPSSPIKFPLGTGGPFYRLQVALRLVTTDRPNLGRRVLIALAITWLPLALLWVWQGAPAYEHAGSGAVAASSLFGHIATYARFFVTVPLLIVAESAVRPYLERALGQAMMSGVVPPAQQGRFREIVLEALRWRESRVAEAVILFLALLVSRIAIGVAATEQHASWIHAGPTLTWAGIWYATVSLPLLQFLVFRWLYRLFIWWRVLHGLARLAPNIQPAHPDQRGGLAFIGDSVQAFGILALAFSAAAAGAVADYVVTEGAPIGELKGFITGAVLCILLLFLAPLGFFFTPLYRAKEEALLRYEGFAERYWQAFERKWLDSSRTAAPVRIAEPDFSAMADLAACVKCVREMKIIPITKEGLMPLLVAIVVPFLPVASMAVPLRELLGGIIHVFLGRAE